MIIEFPRKYRVTPVATNSGKMVINVEVPKDFDEAARIVFGKQDWVWRIGTAPSGVIAVYISGAHEITEAQAVDALERLCDFVISTPIGKEADDD